MLVKISGGDAAGQAPHTPNEHGALGDGNYAASIEYVEQVRAFQAVIVGRQNRESPPQTQVLDGTVLRIEQLLCLSLVQVEELFCNCRIGEFETVCRELLLLRKPHLTIGLVSGPFDVIHIVDVLQIRGDAVKSIGQLNRYGIEVDSPALLEVSKLRYLQPIQQYLPSHAPRP